MERILDDKMMETRKEFDFSKGEHGKFYRPDVELNLPIYLEPDVAKFVRELAEAKNEEIETLVNNWLRQDIALIGERTTSQKMANPRLLCDLAPLREQLAPPGTNDK